MPPGLRSQPDRTGRTDRSNCPVELPGRTARSNCPVERPYSDYPMYPVSLALAIISARRVAKPVQAAVFGCTQACCRPATATGKVVSRGCRRSCDRVSPAKAACGPSRGMVVTLQLPGQRRRVRPADGLYIDVVGGVHSGAAHLRDAAAMTTLQGPERSAQPQALTGRTRRGSDDRMGESAARPC